LLLVARYARHLRSLELPQYWSCTPAYMERTEAGLKGRSYHHQRICLSQIVAHNISTWENGEFCPGTTIYEQLSILPCDHALLNQLQNALELKSLTLNMPRDILEELISTTISSETNKLVASFLNILITKANNIGGDSATHHERNGGHQPLQELTLPLQVLYYIPTPLRSDEVVSVSKQWKEIGKSKGNTTFTIGDDVTTLSELARHVMRSSPMISSLRRLVLEPCDHALSASTMENIVAPLTNLTSLEITLGSSVSFDASKSFARLISLLHVKINQDTGSHHDLKMDDGSIVPARVAMGTHQWQLPSSLEKLEVFPFDRSPLILFNASSLREFRWIGGITLTQIKILMMNSPLLIIVHLDEPADNIKGKKLPNHYPYVEEWRNAGMEWLNDLADRHTPIMMTPPSVSPSSSVIAIPAGATLGGDSISKSSTRGGGGGGVWPKLTTFDCVGVVPLTMLYATILPISNQLIDISIESPQLCIDHVATLLVNNAATLVAARLYLYPYHYNHSYSDIEKYKFPIAESDGSFTRWSSLSKSGSLIMPRLATLELEIGSSTLINALYCPSLSDIILSGTAAVRPLPLIHSIAPICTAFTIDLWHHYKDVRIDRELKAIADHSFDYDDDDKPNHDVDSEDDYDVPKATTASRKAIAAEEQKSMDISTFDMTSGSQASSHHLIPPKTSILDDSFIDEIISLMASFGDRHLEDLSIATGSAYIQYSQMKRLVDYLTSSSRPMNARRSTSVRKFHVMSHQYLLFDPLPLNNNVGTQLAHDYIMMNIFDMIMTIVRFLSPRATNIRVAIPSLPISPSKLVTFQQRIIQSMGALLTDFVHLVIGDDRCQRKDDDDLD
jgi:hypothetical protein